jgi:hypothetical protein
VRWLVVFGIAWFLQSLANGYYMLFGGVLNRGWARVLREHGANTESGGAGWLRWLIASLPLCAHPLKYQANPRVLRSASTFEEAVAFSALRSSVAADCGLCALLGRHSFCGKDNMFPGVVATTLATLAIVADCRARRPGARPSRLRRIVQGAMAVAALASAAALVALAFNGGRFYVSHRRLAAVPNVRSLPRGILLALCGLPLLWLSPVRRVIAARHPVRLLRARDGAHGIARMRSGAAMHDVVILDPAPYRWLMALPASTSCAFRPDSG